MPPEPPQLDIVTVAVIIITALAGGQVASIAGPYAVIVAAALVGSVVALMRRSEYTVLQSLTFVVVVTCVAVLMTGTASIIGARALGYVGIEVHAYYLLAPISGAIAAIGPDWPAVGTWLAGLVRRWGERRVGGGGSS